MAELGEETPALVLRQHRFVGPFAQHEASIARTVTAESVGLAGVAWAIATDPCRHPTTNVTAAKVRKTVLEPLPFLAPCSLMRSPEVSNLYLRINWTGYSGILDTIPSQNFSP